MRLLRAAIALLPQPAHQRRPKELPRKLAGVLGRPAPKSPPLAKGGRGDSINLLRFSRRCCWHSSLTGQIDTALTVNFRYLNGNLVTDIHYILHLSYTLSGQL
jgi:hypothetical protein